MPRPRQVIRATIGIVTGLMLLIASMAAVAWWWARPARPDGFYNPPAAVPVTPGALLRSEPFTRGVPASAEAWRILYTTTRDARTPALASAVVLASAHRPDGPRPVIAWAHGTTGVVQGCGPSLLDEYLVSGGLPALDQIVAQGWVLVATDYAGLGTAEPAPFLIGEGEARSVLDAVRAARQLDGVSLENRVIVWGHSQGGHAALWTGAVATSYAPDVDIVGVAALAPASDLVALVEAAQDTPIGEILSAYIVSAYSQVYGDVRFEEMVRPGARLLARDIAGRCLAGREALLSVVEAMLLGGPIFSADPTTGALAERLAENTPRKRVNSPLLIAQGEADQLVLPSVQQRFVTERCVDGQSLEYRTYGGQDHMGLVSQGSALTGELVAWTHARLAGMPPPSGCPVVARSG
ncbi:MAG: alpha/beta fold hydrolase [Chloroflexota bacterium]